MTQPISPSQIAETKTKIIPDSVIETFNLEIARNFCNGRSVVKQDRIIQALVQRGLSRAELFANHWLDVEDLYRAKGWQVTYEKPGYNESGDSIFTFIPAKEAHPNG